MYVHVCILHECLCMHVGSWFYTCVPVSVSVHYSPPCILGHPPLAKRQAETKVTGLGGKDEGMPQRLKLRRPIPHLEVVSPIDSKGKAISSHLILHLCVSEFHFAAL